MPDRAKILIGPSTFGELDDSPIIKLKNNGCDILDNPYKRKLSKNELLSLLKYDVIGIIAGLEQIDKEVIEKSKLKVISRCGSGISNVDTEAAKNRAILFFCTPYGPT